MIIGIGNDLIDIRRIEKTLDRFGDRFVARIFTPVERTKSERRIDPASSYAKRFAAKEAVMKALSAGLGQVAMYDIEVARDDGGAPSIRLHGSAAELAARRGVGGWLVSLTHDHSAAHAIVVALQGEVQP